MKKAFAILGLAVAVSGCVEGTTLGTDGAAPATLQDAPAPTTASKKAIAALPEGVSPSSLYRSPNGCYSYAVRAEGGYLVPLFSAFTGQQVCDRV